MTKMYDTASTVKHQPKPTVTTSSPASVGPKMRDDVDDHAVEHDCVRSFLGGTISVTNERRSGLSNASRTPPTTAVAYRREHGRVVHERQRGERDRLGHLEALRDEEEVPLVRSVGDRARPDRQQQDRSVLAGDEESDRDRRCSSGGGSSSVNATFVEPVAGVGHQLPDEEQPEVADAKRRERLLRKPSDPHLGLYVNVNSVAPGPCTRRVHSSGGTGTEIDGSLGAAVDLEDLAGHPARGAGDAR